MSPVAEIQSRIADIESRIATLTGGHGQLLTRAAAAVGTAGFAQALSAVDGTVSRASRAVNAAWTGPASAAGTGAQLLKVAEQFKGVPYKWGGTTPAGFDCSGLIQHAGKQIGLNLPRTAAEQAKVGTAVPSLAQARPGDLVVLEGGSHIGIYVGDGKMLHAPKAGDVVKVSTVWETPMTIRRLGTTPGTTPAVLSSALARPASLSGGAAPAGEAPYRAAFAAAESEHGLPAGLLSAVAKQESGYDPRARSSAGAVGLMQFMPATARGMGIDPTDPFQAIAGAGKLLASHLKTFGSLPLALAAYNAGPGNVRKHGGIPPFQETQNYVKKIMTTLGSAA